LSQSQRFQELQTEGKSLFACLRDMEERLWKVNWKAVAVYSANLLGRKQVSRSKNEPMFVHSEKIFFEYFKSLYIICTKRVT